MLAIVCNASFSTTCPRKVNSIENASVLTNFLSAVLNSQTWLVFNFVKNFFFWNLNAIFSLAAKIALIYFETPKTAKMLHNVYKCSCMRQPFTVDLLC
jgi:hypothetical protein